MAPLDPERMRLRNSPHSAASARQTMPPRPKQGERFLKGPVPLAWLSAAANLPGKSLHVGVAIWFLAGLHRSRTVPLNNITSLRFGLDRNAKYRGLEWLEEAGLVTVERRLGCSPRVTLLDPGGGHDAPA
jgi:hypothetical protein